MTARSLRIRDLDGIVHDLFVVGSTFGQRCEVDESLDLSSGYAVAGLVDAHAHLTGVGVGEMAEGVDDAATVAPVHAGRQVDAGVLVVADKGTRRGDEVALEGLHPTVRPELHRAGAMVTVAGGYYPDFAFEVDPGAPPESWLDEVTGSTYSWVKLVGDWPRKGVGPVSNFTRDQLTSIVRLAHDRGMRVAIHAAARGTPSDAVAAGVDSIEHGLFLTEQDLRDLGERGGAWVPTIAAMEGIRDMLGHESSGGRLLNEGLANVADLIDVASGFGVSVLAGTDLHLPHGDVYREVERMVAYGMAPARAVAAATSQAYGYLGSARTFSVGETADVVVLPGDPRDDVGLLGRPSFVMRAGRIVRR